MTILHAGGCLCGKLRFEARGDSRATVYCHCFFCRRHTAAPVATFACFNRPDHFIWTQGSPSFYRSSPGTRRGFCRRCGTPLTFEADLHPEKVHVGIGAFDDPDRLPPAEHLHHAQKIAWFETTDVLPRHLGSRPAGDIQMTNVPSRVISPGGDEVDP